MKSHEVFRDLNQQHGAKQVAALTGVALSHLHKQSRPGPDGESEKANLADRLERLRAGTGDVRVLAWLAERAGMTLVPNAPAASLPPQLLCAENVMELALVDFERAVAAAAQKGGISLPDAAEIRRRWERLKPLGEAFVLACERGAFRLVALYALLAPLLGGDVLPELAEAG